MHVRRVRTAAVAGAAAVVALATAAAAAPTDPPAGPPAVASAPSSLVGLTPELPPDVIAASSAPGSHWQPEKAVYGSASHDDIAIPGVGGTTIRVNEIYPTLADGSPAPGKFPVVM